jgi:tetratricopeptide (TPR) repeat protein
MLKFTYLAQLGLAGTVLVPAVALKQDPAGGLTDALANTRASIVSLERLHTSLTQGDYTKVSTTIDATETPEGTPRTQDERLFYLREEVSKLQMRWDALDAAMSAKVPQPKSSVADTVLTVTPAPETEEAPQATTGLDESARAELLQRLTDKTTASITSAPLAKTSYETPGYTAHAVRHGRAYYKAERYEEALSLLERSKEQAGASFWIACTLEKLGRTGEAISAYQAVIDNPFDVENAEHARRNRDFLVWKREFDARIATTSASVSAQETE